MGYSRPNVSDFKSQFSRDFPYAVPAWGARGAVTVVNGVVTAVAVEAGGIGYAENPDVAIVNPSGTNGTGATVTATANKGRVASFTVGAGGTGYLPTANVIITGGAGDDSDLTRVRDDDILQAQADASFNVNECLFDGQAAWNRAFNYLTAHYLVEKLLAAGEGLASQYNWLTGSKSVGDVSESFVIPDRIKADPLLASFSKTRYGAIYLSIISPLLIGNVATQFRQSLP